MIVEFKKLILENFLSFKNCELSLDRNGFVLVSGINKRAEDDAKSNGSGKSVLWDAISWALTGETIRGTKDVCNIHIDDGCFVDLFFSVDNVNYELLRSKNHSKYKTNIKLFINGEDKSGKGIRDTERIVKEYLCELSGDILGSVILLGQGLPSKFTNNSPIGRKEILEKLSNSDYMIEDLKNRITKRLNIITNEKNTLHDSWVTTTTKLTGINRSLENTKNKLSTLEDKNKLQEQIDILNAEISLIQNKINTFSLEVDSLNHKIDQDNDSLLSLSGTLSNILETLEQQYEPNISVLVNKQSNISNELSVKKNKLREIESIKDICPLCKQKINGVEKPDTTELKKEILLIESNLLAVTNELNTIVDQKNKEKAEKKNEITCKINELRANLDKNKKRKTEINLEIQSQNNSIATKTNQLLLLKNKIQEYETTLTLLNQQIDELEKESVLLNQQKISIEQKESHNNSRLEILKRFESCLKKEFRSLLLSDIVSFINNKAKEYCFCLFNNEKIEFRLEDNNIDILFDNKFYENLSGGEKQKIDLIVQFSIRDMLSAYLNFKSNILVVDEVFDNLDTFGCQKVINCIISKLSDIRTVYIITHHSDLDIPYDSELVVVKNEEGISYIQNGSL